MMGKDSDAIAGIILGLLGIALLAAIFSKRCPVCGGTIPPGQRRCPHCGAVI